MNTIKKTSIMGVFAIFIAMLMISSIVSGQVSNTGMVQANFGETIKLQTGETLEIEDIDIYFERMSSSIVDDVASIITVYDTAVLVISIDNSDAIPVKYSVIVGESITFKDYVVEVTDITADTIGVSVSKNKVVTINDNTAGFNELFKIQVDEEYLIGGALQMKLVYVLSPGALGSAGQGLAEIIVSDANNAADAAPKTIKFNSIPETAVFGDYSITLSERSDGVAMFKVLWKADDSLGVPVQTVKFGEKFQGSTGSVFRVSDTFDVKITNIKNDQYNDAIPSASVNVRYIKQSSVDAAGNNANSRPNTDYTLTLNENVQLPYNHQIVLFDIDSNTATFVIDIKRPIISARAGVELDIVSSDSVIKATQLRIEPGAKDPDVRSASGVVHMKSGVLDEGIDLSAGLGTTVRIRTDSDKLETYLTDGEVTARTRTTLKNNVEGLFVETDSADVKLKILPAAASAKAREVINANFNDLTLEDLDGKIVYKGNSDMEFMVLGFIPVQGKVSVTVDAETGAILDTNKPWYAFMNN
ncbi:MAG: hypothetical protein ACP5NV_01265 [Candidatus Woesearchaeota archaeon]